MATQSVMTSAEAYTKYTEARDAWHETVTFGESYGIGDRSVTKSAEEQRRAMSYWLRQFRALRSIESGNPAQMPGVIVGTFKGSIE